MVLTTVALKASPQTPPTKPIDCPTIHVRVSPDQVTDGDLATFQLFIGGGNLDLSNLQYNWTADRGKIVDGQGTPVVVIDTSNTGPEGSVTATAEVSLNDGICPKAWSQTVRVRRKGSQDISLDWLKLRPLESTRETVEALLGSPTQTDMERSVSQYRQATGTLYVVYSLGRCDASRKKRWNVPAHVMTETFFIFNNGYEPRLSDFAALTKNFKPFEIKDQLFNRALISSDTSIMVGVKDTRQGWSLIASIYLSPKQSERDKYCL